MAEQIAYEDDDVIIWQETVGVPGQPDYQLNQRRQVKPGSATANRETLERQGLTALDTNRTFLALGSPTNAQVLAQTRALTRQNTAIIRLILGALDATD